VTLCRLGPALSPRPRNFPGFLKRSIPAIDRIIHNSRCDPAKFSARKYLVEAAWQGVYRSPTIRAYFERIHHGRPERRKIALVATAHYLLRSMHAMLVRNQPWHEAA